MSFENFFGEAEFDYELEKQKFIDNMDFLKEMSVEESTLWKKWEEFNKDPQFFMDRADTIDRLEKTIWQPTDIYNKELTIQEINSIEPIVEPVEQGNAQANEDWIITRRLIHSMEFTANPGRNVKFYVKDKSTNKVLGLICLGSDVTSLGVRDELIGWTKENKFQDGKLNHTAIGTTICCVQPLGFNMLGGKLVAQMVTSKVVRDTWKKLYGQTLVGISTTALYGIHSMYNGIPQWKTLGETKGKISLKPDDKFVSKKQNPPVIEIDFFDEQKNIQNINCFSNEGNEWRNSIMKFNNNNLQINFREKFTFRRGRVNCSIKEGDIWRWLGIQMSIELN